MTDRETVAKTFRALVQAAERKYAKVRDIPAYGSVQKQHCFQKVFKAYMRVWKYQQEYRAKLVESGLSRWEIGEIASRIGQLYSSQYMRTSETRFLVEAYVFYEAILNRRYFEASNGSGKDLVVRSKELRFYTRFLLVSLILNRADMVKVLAERLKTLVDEGKGIFSSTEYRVWKLVVQEITRFLKLDAVFMNMKSLRYSATVDSHPASLKYLSRFHSKKVLKFQDAVLASYHRNEVKFDEITLDTYRMLQCLEWEPFGPLSSKPSTESNGNGASVDHSAESGIIDMNLVSDSTDPFSPPNPKKVILYRPSVTRLMSVMASICEELPLDSVMLIYLVAAGKVGKNKVNQPETTSSWKSSRNKSSFQDSQELNDTVPESCMNGKQRSGDLYDDCLWFGPPGNGDMNILYASDLVPFTRRPLFLIIDSDSSHAFKVLHGAERGEPAALLLSPLKPTYKGLSVVDRTQYGSQFTFFLTAPLPAFCELVGLSSAAADIDLLNDAESVISMAFSEWEVILCTSTTLSLVWAQVLCDPFLRRLILRFIFCRSVLSIFCPPEDSEQWLPVCLPHLPNSLSPDSEVVKSPVLRLAEHLKVDGSLYMNGS